MFAERPPHVPLDRVIDFDVYEPAKNNEDYHVAWNRLQDPGIPDVIWSPRYGGHWIVTRAQLIETVLADYEHFSNRILAVPKEIGEMGGILPTSKDPPEHGPIRNVLNSSLSPKAIRAAESRIRQLSINLVESVRSNGRCDFTREYAEILPIHIFLDMADLPLSDAGKLTALVSQVLRQEGSVDGGFDAMRAYMLPIAEARRGGSGNDVITHLVNGEINGERVSFDVALRLCTNILLGGLDTVVNFLSFALYFLARHRSHRCELIADPTLIPNAIMELGRRFGVVVTGREIRKDFTFGGCELKKGEVMIAPTMLSGVDDRVNERPLEVNFHRDSMYHTLFGNGSHKCPGALLARTEIKITLEEWLARIPEFSVEENAAIAFKGGVVGGMRGLPLVWDVSTTIEVAR